MSLRVCRTWSLIEIKVCRADRPILGSLLERDVGWKLFRRLAALLALPIAATASDSDSANAAFSGLKPFVDARLRFERVDQEPLSNEAEALTLRARVGFESDKVWNTALLVEGELVVPIGSDYNSTINGKPMYPVVADPESYELNRLQLSNTSMPDTTITLGRQRILLDDQRFVGNVGWRQNEQTFDSVRLVNRSLQNLTLDISYVSRVNRVFGRESPQGRYEGKTWLGNISYSFPPGRLTAFGYQIELRAEPVAPAAVLDSSRTFGLRFSGEHQAGPVKIGYTASRARQREHADNPLRFDLDYALAELNVTYQGVSVGVGIEVLEGDGIKGFTTPLATLHKFQGWADKFTATPPDGIDDRYVSAGLTWKAGALDALSVVAIFHRYEAERGPLEYGSEANLLLQARWQRWNAAIKYADYDAHAWLTDTSKWWIQLEYAR